MGELSKGLMNVAMAGVGAVAIVAEKASEIGKICAAKGAETLEKGRALNEELRRLTPDLVYQEVLATLLEEPVND